jgi:YaiO family outer membrane protein
MIRTSLLKTAALGLVLAMMMSIPASAQEPATRKDEAFRALREKNFALAISICLEELSRRPEDYEFNFCLALAYAFSGEWDKGLSRAEGLLCLHSGNVDVTLLRARLLSWKKDYAGAEAGYRQVLSSSPENVEARVGLAELAAWRGRLAEAANLYLRILEERPDDPDLHFRIGRAYAGLGNYEKARAHFRAAVRLNPENPDYASALNLAAASRTKRNEIRYDYQAESFSDDRKGYRDHQLSLELQMPKDIGPLILSFHRTRRFDRGDSQYGLESYPSLWRNAYAHVSLFSSSPAVHFPRTVYRAEVYQGFSSTELSLGYARYLFADKSASLLSGSVGLYAGHILATLRLYLSSDETGKTFSWVLQARHYFSDDDYLFLAYGQGSRPFDLVTYEDILVRKSQVLWAGFNWRLFGKVRLRGQITYQNEKKGLDRTTVFLSTGYWF